MIIKNKNDILLPSLYQFYKENNHVEIILPIILGNSHISIRVLDWFVTNYCKMFQVEYILDNDKLFNVYLDYKAQLKGYKKKLFDPFCRKKRIPFYYDLENNKYFISTIGQLNFFKWAISKKILNYVDLHLQDIYFHMNKKKIELISSDNITNDLNYIFEEKKIKREKNIKFIYIDKKYTIMNFDNY
jgi:hypothetical protein